MKKAFTIVELLIVTIILGILFVIMSKVYILSSKLYVYQRNLKNVEKDILFLNQNFQNLVDSTQLDFDKYSNLENSLGFTWNLHLKDDTYDYNIFLSGTAIYMIQSWNSQNIVIPLTDENTTKISDLKFKIIPFHDPYKVFGQNAMQPFVTIFIDIKNKHYFTGAWEQNINYNYQESFNFKYFK